MRERRGDRNQSRSKSRVVLSAVTTITSQLRKETQTHSPRQLAARKPKQPLPSPAALRSQPFPAGSSPGSPGDHPPRLRSGSAPRRGTRTPRCPAAQPLPAVTGAGVRRSAALRSGQRGPRPARRRRGHPRHARSAGQRWRGAPGLGPSLRSAAPRVPCLPRRAQPAAAPRLSAAKRAAHRRTRRASWPRTRAGRAAAIGAAAASAPHHLPGGRPRSPLTEAFDELREDARVALHEAPLAGAAPARHGGGPRAPSGWAPPPAGAAARPPHAAPFPAAPAARAAPVIATVRRGEARRGGSRKRRRRLHPGQPPATGAAAAAAARPRPRRFCTGPAERRRAVKAARPAVGTGSRCAARLHPGTAARPRRAVGAAPSGSRGCCQGAGGAGPGRAAGAAEPPAAGVGPALPVPRAPNRTGPAAARRVLPSLSPSSHRSSQGLRRCSALEAALARAGPAPSPLPGRGLAGKWLPPAERAGPSR